MRFSILGLLTVILAAGTSLPASAQNPDALKIVTVAADEFSDTDLSIKKGDTVRWEWEGGAHTILVAGNPAGSEDPEILLTFTLDDATKIQQLQFNEAGTFYFYVQGRETVMAGTITVLEATPVRRSTWGFIKQVFETP